MRKLLHFIHSVNGGYVDTVGFVALHGLLAAHVTGNIVTLAASFAVGAHESIAKLLALPVYCLTVLTIRAMTFSLHERSEPGHLRGLLAVKFGLLGVAAVLGVYCGPFPNADAPAAIAVGMAMLVAMAAQNMLRRLHLAAMPPTTVMTGAITGLMVDLVDLAYRRRAHAKVHADAIVARAVTTFRSLAGFILGAAAATAAYMFLDRWCFVPPVLLSAVAAVVAATVAEEN